jgi:DNA-binding NtrC family response regulator
MNQNSLKNEEYEISVAENDLYKNRDKNELVPTTLIGMERDLIKQTLNKFGGSRRKTARALQISERTLYRKIKEYGL